MGEVLVHILFSIYFLVITIVIVFAITKRKMLFQQIKQSFALKFVANELEKNKRKYYLRYIPVFFIYAISWPFLFIIILIYYKYFKRIKKTYKSGLIAIYSSLHAHAEWFNVLLCLLGFLLILLSSFWIIPENLLYYIASLNLLYVTSYCFYNLISEPGMPGRIKVSIFNVRFFYLVIFSSVFLLFVISFSFLNNGLNQSTYNIVETGKQFLLINPIKEWLENGQLILSPIGILMAICTTIFFTSSSIGLRDLILLKRSDKDLIVVSYALIITDNYNKAKEHINLLTKDISNYESKFVHYLKALIAMKEEQSGFAIEETKKFLDKFSGTKYYFELSCHSSLVLSIKCGHKTKVIEKHFLNILESKLTPITFYIIVDHYLAYLRKKTPSLRARDIIPLTPHYYKLQSDNPIYGVIHAINSSACSTINDNKISVASIDEEDIMDLLIKYYLITKPGLTYKPGKKEDLELLGKHFNRIASKIASSINTNSDWSILYFIFIVHNIVKITLIKHKMVEHVTILDLKIIEILKDNNFNSPLEWINDKIL